MNDILVDDAMNWIACKYRVHGEWVNTMGYRAANDNSWRYE